MSSGFTMFLAASRMPRRSSTTWRGAARELATRSRSLAGIWTDNTFIDTSGLGLGETLQALRLDQGNGVSEWMIGASTLGAVNVLSLRQLDCFWARLGGDGDAPPEPLAGSTRFILQKGVLCWGVLDGNFLGPRSSAEQQDARMNGRI